MKNKPSDEEIINAATMGFDNSSETKPQAENIFQPPQQVLQNQPDSADTDEPKKNNRKALVAVLIVLIFLCVSVITGLIMYLCGVFDSPVAPENSVVEEQPQVSLPETTAAVTTQPQTARPQTTQPPQTTRSPKQKRPKKNQPKDGEDVPAVDNPEGKEENADGDENALVDKLLSTNWTYESQRGSLIFFFDDSGSVTVSTTGKYGENNYETTYEVLDAAVVFTVDELEQRFIITDTAEDRTVYCVVDFLDTGESEDVELDGTGN